MRRNISSRTNKSRGLKNLKNFKNFLKIIKSRKKGLDLPEKVSYNKRDKSASRVGIKTGVLSAACLNETSAADADKTGINLGNDLTGV